MLSEYYSKNIYTYINMQHNLTLFFLLLLTEMISSNFHESFMFLTRLAYKNRLTIPTFVCIAFLVCNFRWEIEISIQTERIEQNAGNLELSDSDDSEYEPVSDDESDDASDL
jgi:hypothetical protein